MNLDIFWLKDDALEGCANLPAPEIIATDITADLEQFATIAEDLKQRSDEGQRPSEWLAWPRKLNTNITDETRAGWKPTVVRSLRRPDISPAARRDNSSGQVGNRPHVQRPAVCSS